MPAPTALSARSLAMLMPELTAQGGPLYRSLADAIAALLLDGRIATGTRLPSDRALAAELSLSRATTTAAYDQLATESLLRRRRGSGSFLTLPEAAQVSGPGSRMSRMRREEGTIDLSIASLSAAPGVIEAAIEAASLQLRRHLMLDGYHPYGLTELRSQIAQRYEDRGVRTSVDEILVVNGAQHGFDVILRALLTPGDRVLTELPTYPGAIEAIRLNGGRVMAVPLTGAHGWDLEAITNTLNQSAPKFAYLMPDFQNPTGLLANTAQRRSIAAAARRCGTRLVIDESFVDIDLREPAEANETFLPMAAVDSTALCIGSLSKPVWGGLRVGWIRADAATVQQLAAVRARSDMAGAVLEQLLAVEVLGKLEDFIAARRTDLRRQRDVLLEALHAELPTWRTGRPLGGLSTWVELDAPAATTLTHLLEQRGVLITPGSRFGPDASLERFLRIPFALGEPEIRRAVSVIAETWAGIDTARLRRTDSSLVTA